MNGVLWVLRTGAPWHDLPGRYPPYQTCHRRFQLLPRSGRLDRLLQRLAEDLRDRGKIDLSEAFVDATFASAIAPTEPPRIGETDIARFSFAGASKATRASRPPCRLASDLRDVAA